MELDPARDGLVVVNDLDEGPAKETVTAIEAAGGDAVACTGSVTGPGFAERFVQTAVDAYGGLDIIVNNAGYTWDSVIQKMADEQWDAILDLHLKAPFRTLRAAQPVISRLYKAEVAQGLRPCVPVRRQRGPDTSRTRTPRRQLRTEAYIPAVYLPLEHAGKSQVSAQMYLACTGACTSLRLRLPAVPGRIPEVAASLQPGVPNPPEPIFRERMKKGPENRISLVSG